MIFKKNYIFDGNFFVELKNDSEIFEKNLFFTVKSIELANKIIDYFPT